MNDCRHPARARVLRLRPPGHLDPLLDMGVLKPPLQVSCVMGVTGGIRPTARNLAHMAEQVPDVPHQWGVIGISRAQWRLVAAALSLGGNVRVGLEDNFYLPDGEMARSNGDLVARAARMAEDAGRRVATVAEARGLLGLMSALGGPARARPLAAAAGRVLLAAAGRLRRRRDQGRGHRDGRLRARRPAVVPVAEPRQAVDPARPQDPTAGATRSCGWSRDADVVLESFRPGVMDRLGVGYERAARGATRGSSTARSPATGRTGRCAARAGHDMNYLARTGCSALSGDAGRAAGAGGGADRRPRRRRADGGVRHPRARCAPARASSSTSRWPTARCRCWRWPPRGCLAGGAAPRRGEHRCSAGGCSATGPYACADGWVSLGALEPKFWARVVPRRRARGPDRAPVRRRRARDAHREVEAVFAGRTRAEWEAFNAEHDCCLEPVLELDEALRDEQVRARGMVVGRAARRRRSALARRRPTRARRPGPGSASTPTRCCAEARYERIAEDRSRALTGRAAPRGESRSDAFFDPARRRALPRDRAHARAVGPAPSARRAARPRCSTGAARADARRATDMVLARVTVEILGAVPIAEVEVETTVERPGRSVELLAGELRADGRAGAARARLARARRRRVGTRRPSRRSPLPEDARSAAARARRDVRLRARGRVALGGRRLGASAGRRRSGRGCGSRSSRARSRRRASA